MIYNIYEKAQAEKVKTMQSIGASIAHELRTPLRSILSGVSGIEKFLPTLLHGYDLAKKEQLGVETINPYQMQLLHLLEFYLLLKLNHFHCLIKYIQSFHLLLFLELLFYNLNHFYLLFQ